MSYNLKSADITLRNISFGTWRVYKGLRQSIGSRPDAGDKSTLMILGIQRAGTSMMYWVFERDFDVKVYRESSELSSDDRVEGVRLNPLPWVRARIEEQKAPIVVLKPLVESQRAAELLAALPGSRALWAYRHYQDVAASNLKAFGRDNGINDLRPFVTDDPDNWRSQGSSEETRETIRHYFAEDMNPYDAAALFWWARSRLYFELGLDQHPDVMLNRYEDLVTQPVLTMRRIYDFIERPYPGDQIVRDVHPQSVGKGRVSRLSPEVDRLCAELLAELDHANEREAVS